MTNDDTKDQVFSTPLSEVKAFEFDDKVTRVFRDMISRSVPGYTLLLRMIGLYANIFVQKETNVYDLGCSLGEVSKIISDQSRSSDCTILAVDNSLSMINKCRQKFPTETNIKWLCEDIQAIDIQQASMVVLNLTLMFLTPEERQVMLANIFQGLVKGGVLILSEKILLDEDRENARMIQLHQAFKKTQGYSDLEISQKRSALENVLQPDLDSLHRERLKKTGFDEVYLCFRCFNFVSYLAIKQ